VIVLQGPSSSGKSTILKLILGDLTASSGSVQISSFTDENNTTTRATHTNPAICPVPILLDHQKPTYEETFQSIRDCLEDIYRPLLVHKDDEKRMTTLVSELLEIVGLDRNRSILSLTPAQLTTSERFRLEIVFASLKSMLQMGIPNPHSIVAKDGSCCIPTTSTKQRLTLFPAPILCIDEWFDQETSKIIQPIGEALKQLATRWGAVIIVVTHKPERFAKLLRDDNTMIVQLRRGRRIQGDVHPFTDRKVKN
jgi:ABC-type thiamine transport system ATPase subunit